MCWVAKPDSQAFTASRSLSFSCATQPVRAAASSGSLFLIVAYSTQLISETFQFPNVWQRVAALTSLTLRSPSRLLSPFDV